MNFCYKMVAQLEQLANKLQVPQSTNFKNDTKAKIGHTSISTSDQEDITNPLLFNSSDNLGKMAPYLCVHPTPPTPNQISSHQDLQSELSNMSEFKSNMEIKINKTLKFNPSRK